MNLNILPATLGTVRTAAIVSSVLVLPFMILELVTRRVSFDFPIVLFAFMWLMALSFIVILTPILRSLQTKHGTLPNFSLLLRIVGLILIAWMWVSLVVDQMPCFLGVPNCD